MALPLVLMQLLRQTSFITLNILQFTQSGTWRIKVFRYESRVGNEILRTMSLPGEYETHNHL